VAAKEAVEAWNIATRYLPESDSYPRVTAENIPESLGKNLNVFNDLVCFRNGTENPIGVDNRLTTGPYEVAGRWALALWRHPDSPDGILYRSKHDPNHICAAIFDRGHCEFAVTTTRPLMDIPHHWAPILGAHGKGIA
jgi:RES domain